MMLRCNNQLVIKGSNVKILVLSIVSLLTCNIVIIVIVETQNYISPA